MMGLFIEFPVFGDVVTPLRGHGEFVENRVYRAHRHAVRAVDASGRVDEIHLFRVGGGDAVHGADFNTGGIFNPGTRLSNYVGHTITIAEITRFLPMTLNATIAHGGSMAGLFSNRLLILSRDSM